MKMTGLVDDMSEGKKQISKAVTGGEALARFSTMMTAQGVASETAKALCSAHVDYFTILRKSKHQMELQTTGEGKN